MSWAGKLIGGALGMWLAGPLGAVAGAAFGHAFDNAGDEAQRQLGYGRRNGGPGARSGHGAHAFGDMHEPHGPQAAFFVATFSLLAKLAKADGVVSRSEVEMVDSFIRRQLGLNAAQRQIAIRIFNEAKDSPYSAQSFAKQLAEIFAHEPAMLGTMLDVLHRLAMADGALHPAEEAMLNEVAQVFGIPQQRRQQHYGNAYGSRGDTQAYAVLGVQASDSDATVKAAYRKKVAEYHPDKIMAKGLPPEFEAFATQKLQELNQAYDELKKQRKSL